MRVVVQRVSEASVCVDGERVGAIDKGLCVLLGIGPEDTEKEASFLAKKLAKLRVFPDEQGKMSKSVLDEQAGILVVSQFTLYGQCCNGCRPDFTRAAPPKLAEPLYEYFLSELERELGRGVESGRFGQMMQVSLVNDGPVTLIIER